MAVIYAGLEKLLANLDEVQDELYAGAERVAAGARARLAAHRVTGKATIEHTQGNVDHYVSLVDEAANAIEYGHGPQQRDGHTIPASQGLYILTQELSG